MRYVDGKPVEDRGIEISPEDQYMDREELKEEAPEVGIIKELNPRSNLEDLKNNILGRIWDSNQRKYIDIGEALMSEKGAGRLMTALIGPVSSLTTFSNYPNEDMVNQRVRFTCKQIIYVVYMDHKKFGVEKCNLPLITELVFNWVDASFRKALGAGERNLVRGTLSEQIRSGGATSQRMERESVWGRLNPLRRGR